MPSGGVLESACRDMGMLFLNGRLKKGGDTVRGPKAATARSAGKTV